MSTPRLFHDCDGVARHFDRVFRAIAAGRAASDWAAFVRTPGVFARGELRDVDRVPAVDADGCMLRILINDEDRERPVRAADGPGGEERRRAGDGVELVDAFAREPGAGQERGGVEGGE